MTRGGAARGRDAARQRSGFGATRGGAARRSDATRRRSAIRSTGSGFTRGTRAGAQRVRGGSARHTGRFRDNAHHGGDFHSDRFSHHNDSHHHGHSSHHSYYGHHGLYLGYYFGAGLYAGYRYYYPYHHYGNDYAFYYSAPVSYAYVPYGFYGDTAPVYIDRTVYINENYPVEKYEVTEQPEAPAAEGPAAGEEMVEPEAAAGTPTVERFLRDGSTAFHEGDYQKAAEQFRLAAISSPEHAGAFFALGQSLLALQKDQYAARVIRRAVKLNPKLVAEGGDIVGVYQSQDEFDKVLGELKGRAEASPAGADARFLLGVQYYFSGDPRSRGIFQDLAKHVAYDDIVEMFRTAVAARFKGADVLPPIDDK